MTMDAATTVTYARMQRFGAVALVLVGLLIGTLAFAASAGASVSDGGSSAPSISSDLVDYPPGATVTLRGTNWQPGESVRIVVDDDGVDERRWQRDVSVTADEAGEIVDRFNLPDWFVADYTVTATGERSGTAGTTFTDAISTTTTLTSNLNPSSLGQP